VFSLKAILRTGIAIAVLVAISSLLTYNLAVRAQSVTTSTAPSRHYYLTKTAFDGSHVLGSCATGYHVASIWEIHEPALLTYNKSLGFARPDDGAGPPILAGWARTGEFASATSGVAGVDNCNVWTSNSSTDQGTAFSLVNSTTSSTGIDPWSEELAACIDTVRVWCVQN
jgi:hypothetical protein